MRKLFGRIVLFFVILAALLTFSITAQAQTTVPFTATAQVSGVAQVPTTVAVPAATTVKVPGLGAVREGVAELQERFGIVEDKLDNTYGALERIEAKVDGLAARPAPDNNLSGWGWLLAAIALILLAIAAFRNPNVAVTQDCHRECNCDGGCGRGGHGDGSGTPMAHIPAIVGTVYRIDHPALAETTQRRIEELRMDENTAKLAEAIVRLISEMMQRRSDKDKPSAATDVPVA